MLFNRVKETATAMDKMLEKLNKTHLILSSPGKNEEVDLHQLVHELMEKFNFSNEQIKWQYEINLPTNIIKIDCSIALFTAIDYLVENAIDFARNPSELQISILINELSSNLLEIKISDNGDGLKHEIVPRIFDMYYRGSMRSKGNGLGLYVVKKAVEKMKGKITVDQTSSKGATFIMTIPFTISEQKKAVISK
jgi:signal transduction histidine kinase